MLLLLDDECRLGPLKEDDLLPELENEERELEECDDLEEREDLDELEDLEECELELCLEGGILYRLLLLIRLLNGLSINCGIPSFFYFLLFLYLMITHHSPAFFSVHAVFL